MKQGRMAVSVPPGGVSMHISKTGFSPPNGWVQARAVFAKDLLAETRNRTAINAFLLFAVTSLVVVSFAAPGSLTGELKSALLWIILFFAAFSGLAHVFLHEEEAQTALALRQCASPGAVYAGKLLINLLLLAVMTAVVAPLFAFLLGLSSPRPGLLFCVIASGCLGLGSAATIVAAITTKARGKGALFGALGFPVLIPQLMVAVNGTRLCLAETAPAGEIGTMILGLVAFAAMTITISALVFPFVWEE